jgi:putative exosortase-associated protein (TIGR04073 family)
MKNRIILLLAGALLLSTPAFADIQASPASKWDWSRKLSRSLANIAYGWSEYPIQWQKVDKEDGTNAAFTSGIVQGTHRSVVRLGYGLYEFATFPFPSYKGGYRPPYKVKERFNPWYGYEEFPPQVGFTSQAGYSRNQSW